MATLFFRVFETAEATALGDPLEDIVVNIAATSTPSTVIPGSGKKRRTVRFFADANCFVTWGLDPTAKNDGSDGEPLGSENPEYHDVEAGHKIAVIQR